MADTPDDSVDEDAENTAEMLEFLENLKEEHRRIDIEIGALEETGVVDVLKVRRMKKIKLSIKPNHIIVAEKRLSFSPGFLAKARL